MPKNPITYREVFYTEVRGTAPGNPLGVPTLKPLEWNHVETELGTMVEPRSYYNQPDTNNKVVQADMNDNSINKISMIEEHAFQNQYGTGGSGMIDYGV